MKEFTTTAGIRATPEAVWAILTDGPGYARWNPEINRVEGRIALGETLRYVLPGATVRRLLAKCPLGHILGRARCP